jgi:hypothetical protein
MMKFAGDNRRMLFESGGLLCRILLLAMTFLACPLRLAHAGEVSLSARITYEIPDGVYVDKGTEQGLKQGCTGTLRLDDGRMLEFEVLHAVKQSALLRLAGGSATQDKLAGRLAEMAFETDTAAPKGAQDANEPSRRKSAASLDGDFVPLLAPPSWVMGVPRADNIFHGQVNIRHLLQRDNEYGLDYSVTHLGSSGSLERIEGSPWGFEWSGDVSYRDGDAYRSNPDYQDPRLDLYMASFQRPVAGDGFLRFGRFLPRELPGIGYVDGLQGQIRHSDRVRIGAIAGFKPDRRDLGFSANEPLFAPYATFEAGERTKKYYMGTVGLLTSLYEGKADRLALLLDQRADLDPQLSVYSTAQVDFDIGGAEDRSGTRLTRLDTFAVYKLSSALSFRAGLDHWERPDNQAERDLLAFEDERFFDSGYWRYWVGGDQGLPWKLRLSEEISIIDSPTTDYDPHWRLGLTRTDLFGWQGASATATIYNLPAENVDGYGGRLSAYLPLLQHKLYIQPIVGIQLAEIQPQGRQLDLNYLSLRLNGRLSANWSLFGGITNSSGDNVDSTLLDFGLRYAW